MRHARRFLSRGWLYGLLFAFPGLTFAVDCPVDGTGQTPPEWPTSRTPTGTWSVTPVASLQTKCGISINENASLDTDGWASMAAAYAYVQAGVTPAGSSVVAQCLDVSGSTYGIWYVFQTASTPTVKHKAFKIAANTTAAECTPVIPTSECAAGEFGIVDGRGATVESVLKDDLGNSEMCWGTCLVTVEALGPGLNKECVGDACTWWWTGIAKTTGDQCNTTTQDPVPSPEPVEPEDALPFDQYADGENCVLSESGVEMCDSFDPMKNQKNCGYVNDNFRCLDSIQPDNCWVMADGGRLCGEDAQPPTAPTAPAPAPPSQRATPTDQMASNTTNNTYNYYNSSVVGSSQRPVTADGSNPVTGTPGASGDGQGEEEGQGSASGGQTCTTPPVCSGDPIQCAILQQEWKARCPDGMTDAEIEAEFGPDGDADNDGKFDLFNDEVEVPSSFGPSNAGPLGEQCLDDYSVNMGSMGTYEIPLSELCWLIQSIGVLVMVSAYVSGARIVAGGL